MRCSCPEPYGRTFPHLSRCPASDTSKRYQQAADFLIASEETSREVVAVCRFTPTDVTPRTGDFIAIAFSTRQAAERWSSDERWDLWHSDLMILDLQEAA